MKRFAAIILAVMFLAGCTPIERTAYNTVVAGKAALVSFRSHHPECSFDPRTGLSRAITLQPCLANNRLTGAKDLIIDAAEVYCASPAFESGGACTPPAKGTPAFEQAYNKLTAAISAYNQTAADLKGVIQ